MKINLAAIVISGALIPTEQYSCMTKVFIIPSTISSHEGTQSTLCPGSFNVKSCETKAAVFQQRVQNIENILLAAVQVVNGKAR